MPSNHLILCRPLLLLPSVFSSIRVFSNKSVLHIRWPKYWSFSFSINTTNEYSGLMSFRIDWFDLLAVQGTLKSVLQQHSSKASITSYQNHSYKRLQPPTVSGEPWGNSERRIPAIFDYTKAFDCVDHNKLWKILQETGIPDHLTCLLKICMQVKKQQLEPDMEQWTGSKLGKEYVKAVYCHPDYLTYMQSTSCEIPGWMKHKLESRLSGKISIISDTQMTLPLWQKVKRN